MFNIENLIFKFLNFNTMYTKNNAIFFLSEGMNEKISCTQK
jgi:hypothetical protein